MWNRCGIIPYPLRNRTSTDGIHFGRLTLWITFTPDPPLGHWVALFQVTHPCSPLNESTNDRALSPIRAPNSKDRPNKWENLSNLSTNPQSCVEPMWDHIRHISISSSSTMKIILYVPMLPTNLSSILQITKDLNCSMSLHLLNVFYRAVLRKMIEKACDS